MTLDNIPDWMVSSVSSVLCLVWSDEGSRWDHSWLGKQQTHKGWGNRPVEDNNNTDGGKAVSMGTIFFVVRCLRERPTENWSSWSKQINQANTWVNGRFALKRESAWLGSVSFDRTQNQRVLEVGSWSEWPQILWLFQKTQTKICPVNCQIVLQGTD